MTTDQHPIPREALPPGWGPAELRDGRFSYRRNCPPLELIADRTTPDRCHPGLGLSHCWELRYRYLLADRAITEAIGRVSTRQAAVDGLLECMHRIHDHVEEPTNPIEIGSILDRVSFADLVPNGLSEPG
ncbi:hypothetical protein [Halopiger djelfimassiliensis]|uniref:hypothetical protein n=1 Tax=Halopiger djelfimassiliensis TaxID=1293047 RepID=UPI000677953E|nr:hypothetical protein [Halopiger djelfimassiliensis]